VSAKRAVVARHSNVEKRGGRSDLDIRMSRYIPARRKPRTTTPHTTTVRALFRIDRTAPVGRVATLSRQNRMTLGNLLTVDQIIPEMKSTERWSAIVELIDLLVGLGKIKTGNRDAVLAALRAREETMSTGIGLGIAIPHASSDQVGEVVAAFGRSSTGIEFDSLDNAPVKFVVLFISPKDQAQVHLRTLAAIAKFLNDRTVRERLATATTPAEILDIFGGGGPAKA
jgi:mannitol/fructose-specific phosphotransferase system IIA component (Ntr-type)